MTYGGPCSSDGDRIARRSHGPLLYLVSTDAAPAGSAAHVLRPDSRDEPAALARLAAAASSSTSAGTGKARARFLALSAADQGIFLSRIFMLDSAPHLEDVDAKHVALCAGPCRKITKICSCTCCGAGRMSRRLVSCGTAAAGSPCRRSTRRSMTCGISSLYRLPTLAEMRDADPAELFAAYNGTRSSPSSNGSAGRE